MKFDIVSILIGIGTVSMLLPILWYSAAALRNWSRYDIPKFMPRDEIVAWSMVMMSSIRHWDYERTPSIVFENYDLGILSCDVEEHDKDYDIFPQVTDVIIYPGKWGRQYATVIHQKLRTISGRQRYAITFIGEIKNGKLYRGRNVNSYKAIS